MPSLRDIRKRIRSVQNTQKITKAMKMVAAAKLRRAQEAVERSRPYADGIRRILGSLASRVEPGAHPLLTERPVKRVEVLVVTSDRGLCGAFNSNVLRAAERFVRESPAEVSVSTVGRKARGYFTRRGARVAEHFAVPIDKMTYAEASSIGARLAGRYSAGEVDEVRVVFTRFRSALSQVVCHETLLPVRALPADPGARADVPTGDYLYEASQEQVLGDLVPRYVNSVVFNMMIESAASEQGARMTAMDSATGNAATMIATLTLNYNRARQAAITKELMEIIGGAEALKG